jgi:hypothetical protein
MEENQVRLACLKWSRTRGRTSKFREYRSRGISHSDGNAGAMAFVPALCCAVSSFLLCPPSCFERHNSTGTGKAGTVSALQLKRQAPPAALPRKGQGTQQGRSGTPTPAFIGWRRRIGKANWTGQWALGRQVERGGGGQAVVRYWQRLGKREWLRIGFTKRTRQGAGSCRDEATDGKRA